MDGYGGCLWTHTGRAVCTISVDFQCRQDFFATDSPWGGQKEFAEYFRNLPPSDEEKEGLPEEMQESFLECPDFSIALLPETDKITKRREYI